MSTAWRLGAFLDRAQEIVINAYDSEANSRNKWLPWILETVPKDTTKLEQLVVKAVLGEIVAEFWGAEPGPILTRLFGRRVPFAEEAGASSPDSVLRDAFGISARFARPVSIQVSAAVEVMQRCHMDRRFGLGDVARLVHLSRWHLSHLFRQQTGCTFSGHLRRIRAAHARELLRTTTLSVKEVAAVAGYTAVNDLDRNFRIIYGMTPTAYRRGIASSASD